MTTSLCRIKIKASDVPHKGILKPKPETDDMRLARPVSINEREVVDLYTSDLINLVLSMVSTKGESGSEILYATGAGRELVWSRGRELAV